MGKNSEDDFAAFAAEFNEAHARISAVVRACAETLTIACVMAALGESLVETSDALMTMEQEMKGTTAITLLSARDLLQIIAQQVERRAAALQMDPGTTTQVH